MVLIPIKKKQDNPPLRGSWKLNDPPLTKGSKTDDPPPLCSTMSKNEQKINVESLKNLKISAPGT